MNVTVKHKISPELRRPRKRRSAKKRFSVVIKRTYGPGPEHESREVLSVEFDIQDNNAVALEWFGSWVDAMIEEATR